MNVNWTNKRKQSRHNVGWLLLLTVALTACGGTKLIKDAEPLVLEEPLAVNKDNDVSVALRWLIVRNGHGSWAKNADWDEYLLTVSNGSESNIQITDFVIVDSQGYQSQRHWDRKELVSSSRDVVKRYKDYDLKVKAGMSGGAMAAAGGGALMVGSAAAMASWGASLAGTSTAAASATATTATIAFPVLVVGGIVRASNNADVTKEMVRRATPLPITVGAGESRELDVFFPLAPSPQRIELHYIQDNEKRRIAVDTSLLLDGLHLPDAPPSEIT